MKTSRVFLLVVIATLFMALPSHGEKQRSRVNRPAPSKQSDIDVGSFEIKPLVPPTAVQQSAQTEADTPVKPQSTRLQKQEETQTNQNTPNPAQSEVTLSTEIPKGIIDATAVREANLQLLSKYDLMILIDESGSMGTADCDGKSRWTWCEDEARRFGEISGSVLPNGFDLTLFNWTYRPMGPCRTENLHQIFSNHHPHGGTILGTPINYVMNRFANLRGYGNVRPLLVAIITDGEPQDVEETAAAIEQITKSVPKGEVKFVFLKVGQSTYGDDFMRNLDDALVSHGAAYDAVDARSFDHLRNHGLLQTLCDAIRE